MNVRGGHSVKSGGRLRRRMALVKDPICGMTIESTRAGGTSAFQGKTFYFCSASCKRTFDKDPARWAKNA